jgi:prepilin-type N-terminal cleavage/methylation domain-containing protein
VGRLAIIRLVVLEMKRAGFSLVEMLVVLSVVVLVFGGIGYAGMRDYSRRQRVVASYRTLVSDLRYAQKQAVSGVKPAGCVGVLDGYLFETANCTGGTCVSYTIKAKCGGVLTSPVKLVDLPFQIVIVVSNVGGAGILFKSLGAGTNLTGDATITLTDNSLSPPATISVGVLKTGEIK